MATRKTKSTKSAKTTSPVKKTPTKSVSSKATSKTASAKTTTAKNETVTTSASQSSAKQRFTLPQVRVKKKYLLIGLGTILLLALLVYFRSLFIVATINGQPVSRLSYIKELEQLSGQQALNSLVTKTLILQEARNKNVSVSDQEINDEIKTIEENLSQQGQQLDSVLQLQGMTRESLREQIYLQKLIEKMVGENVTVGDKEVDEYITQNQETLPEGSDAAALRTQVKEQLQQQKLNEQVQSWLQDLQQNADVQYWINQNQ